MTLNKLIKLLEQLRDQGYGRRNVVADKDSLWDGNDTFNACDINSAYVEWLATVDGDGFAQYRKDGTERGSVHVLLSGNKGGQQ
jgi:hypothetical protein